MSSNQGSRSSRAESDDEPEDFEPILDSSSSKSATALAEDHDSLLRYFLKLFYPEQEARMATRAKANAPSSSLSHGFVGLSCIFFVVTRMVS